MSDDSTPSEALRLWPRGGGRVPKLLRTSANCGLPSARRSRRPLPEILQNRQIWELHSLDRTQKAACSIAGELPRIGWHSR